MFWHCCPIITESIVISSHLHSHADQWEPIESQDRITGLWIDAMNMNCMGPLVCGEQMRPDVSNRNSFHIATALANGVTSIHCPSSETFRLLTAFWSDSMLGPRSTVARDRTAPASYILYQRNPKRVGVAQRRRQDPYFNFGMTPKIIISRSASDYRWLMMHGISSHGIVCCI